MLTIRGPPRAEKPFRARNDRDLMRRQIEHLDFQFLGGSGSRHTAKEQPLTVRGPALIKLIEVLNVSVGGRASSGGRMRLNG